MIRKSMETLHLCCTLSLQASQACLPRLRAHRQARSTRRQHPRHRHGRAHPASEQPHRAAATSWCGTCTHESVQPILLCVCSADRQPRPHRGRGRRGRPAPTRSAAAAPWYVAGRRVRGTQHASGTDEDVRALVQDPALQDIIRQVDAARDREAVRGLLLRQQAATATGTAARAWQPQLCSVLQQGVRIR